MRIAQIIDTLYVGGAEQLQVFFAEASVAHGTQPTVIYLTDSSHTHLPTQLRRVGAAVIEFSGYNLFDPFRFFRLVQFLRRERFDVLHAHLNYAIILCSIAGLITHTPVVVTLHNMHKMEHWGRLGIYLIKLTARHIIAVGPSVLDVYRSDLPGKRMSVVANPVMPIPFLSDSERMTVRNELAVEADRPILISVGRVTLQKGFDHLLTALDILRRTHPRVFLVIVGKTLEADKLSSQIQLLDLQSHVRMLGVRADVPRLMAASDLYVSSSISEGMPITILEAMAAGLPVVATAVGDVPYVITEKTGVLVPPADPELLSVKLGFLLDRPLLRQQMGDAGREYVAANHNLDAWFNSLMVIYEDAVSSFGRKGK